MMCVAEVLSLSGPVIKDFFQPCLVLTCWMNLFVDDLSGEMTVPPSKKLEDLIHLAELCVDLLQQNEEHYAEVSVLLIYLT